MKFDWVKINNKDGTKNLPKEDVRRVLIFSPCYDTDSPNRIRWVDVQFVRILTDATYWASIPEPKDNSR